jgi:hypothetical protein
MHAYPGVPQYPVWLVADPDPKWIRIQSGQWIRIRDTDPGGQKLPTKCLRAEGFFCNLDVRRDFLLLILIQDYLGIPYV